MRQIQHMSNRRKIAGVLMFAIISFLFVMVYTLQFANASEGINENSDLFNLTETNILEFDNPEKPAPQAISVADDSITLQWEPVENATRYSIATQNDDEQTYYTYTQDCTDTTYTIGYLQEGKTYKCLVRAYVKHKWTEFSTEDLLLVTTKIIKPNPIATPSGDGKVTLEWEPIENAEKYCPLVYLDGQWNELAVFDSSKNSFEASDLANGHEHTFTVIAYVEDKWTSISSGNWVRAIPVGTTKPTLETPKTINTNLVLNWNHVPGSKYYAVQTRVKGGSFVINEICTAETSTLTDLIEGTEYEILVQAYVWNDWSKFTSEDIVKIKYAEERPKPVLVDKGDGYANIKWEPVTNATKYAIAEMENGTYRNYTTEWTGTTYKCDDLANGYGHNILVQAYVNGKWTNFTKEDYLLVDIEGTTVKPTAEVDSTTDHSVKLKWNHVPGAKGYAAAVKDRNGQFKTVFVGPEKLTAEIDGLIDSEPYDGLVQASIYGVWSSFTEEDFVEATTKGNRPAPREVSTGDGYAEIEWDAIPGATAYAIATIENGTYKNYSTTCIDTSYHCDNLANGYSHYILVQAQVDGKWSPFSKDNYLLVSVDGPTKKPTTAVSSTTDNSVTVTWSEVPGASQYAAAVRDKNGKYISVYLKVESGKPHPTSATISGLNEAYEYKAIVQSNIFGAWSSFSESEMVIAKTTSNRPAPREVATGSGYADIEWDAIPGATKYAIAEIENGVNKNYTTDCTATSYHCDNLANEYGHNILVQAFIGGKWTSFDSSNYLLVTPHGPTKPQVTHCDIDGENVIVYWDYVPGATVYAVALQNDDGTFKTYTTSDDWDRYYFYGLKPNKTYKVLVQANIYGQWSSFTEADLYTFTTECSLKASAVYSGSSGNYTLKLYYDKIDHSAEGEVMVMHDYDQSPPWWSKKSTINSVAIDSSFKGYKPKYTSSWFSVLTSETSCLSSITGLNNIDTSNVIDMSFMFSNCKLLSNLDVSGFNTANVTNMQSMFASCEKLTTLNLSSFNTAKVTDMSFMLYGCSSLGSVNLSSFNTSNVSNFWCFLEMCKAIKSVDITNFNFNKAENTSMMFCGCQELTTIFCNSDLRNLSKLTNSSGMFSGCLKLVGGAGTAYNYQHIDKNYACVDGGPSSASPGYFKASA